MRPGGRGRQGLIWWRTSQGRRRLADVVTYAVLLPLTAGIVFPFLWMLVSALRPGSDLYLGRLVPWPLTLEHFAWALHQRGFLLPLRNSVIVAGLTALTSTALAGLGAYSLVAYRYTGKRAIVLGVLAINLLPGVLLIVPAFVLIRALGLHNSYPGLVLASTALSAPAAMLVLRGFFGSLPPELVEAAMLDGCGRLVALRRVVLPLARPGIVTAVMLGFVSVWNDVLYALVLTRDVSRQTVSVALNVQAQAQFSSVNWSGLLAEGVLVALPVVVLFGFLQRYLVQGLASVSLR